MTTMDLLFTKYRIYNLQHTDFKIIIIIHSSLSHKKQLQRNTTTEEQQITATANTTQADQQQQKDAEVSRGVNYTEDNNAMLTFIFPFFFSDITNLHHKQSDERSKQL